MGTVTFDLGTADNGRRVVTIEQAAIASMQLGGKGAPDAYAFASRSIRIEEFSADGKPLGAHEYTGK